MSLFQGLEIGKKALLATQASMNTTGHNIANVNTPGFTRQRTIITNSSTLRSTYGPLGAGVTVTTIERIRSDFLTARWREENQGLGRWSSRATGLQQIESFFNEPQDTSLGELLNDFWAAWQEVSKNPDATETRAALVQTTKVLTNGFHQIDTQLTELRKSVDDEVAIHIGEINKLGREIADINRQIAAVEIAGDTANDLRDQRDYLIDQLSQYAEVRQTERERGQVTVYLGSMGFVDGADFWELETEEITGGDMTITGIKWKNTTLEPQFFNGEMKALLEMRDDIVPDYISKLDDLAQTLVETINGAHRSAYGLQDAAGIASTGNDFFDTFYTTAGTIKIDLRIETDLDLIAASTSGEVGDGSNAQAIADILKKARVLNDNTATIDEFYRQMVGQVGTQSSEAIDQQENYELLVQQLENQKQALHGVSLDEEMANLVKFQHSYDAAARIINFIDESLDTLINGTGVVGR